MRWWKPSERDFVLFTLEVEREFSLICDGRQLIIGLAPRFTFLRSPGVSLESKMGELLSSYAHHHGFSVA